MSSELRGSFKYEIGDAVTFLSEVGTDREPPRLIVVQRVVEECHGGVQTHYAVRLAADMGFGQRIPQAVVTWIPSIEITAYPTDEEREKESIEREARRENLRESRREAISQRAKELREVNP